MKSEITPSKSLLAASFLLGVLLCACSNAHPEPEGRWLTYVSLIARKTPYTPPSTSEDPAGSLGTLRAVKFAEDESLSGLRVLDEELVFGETVRFAPNGRWLTYETSVPGHGVRLKLLSFEGGAPGKPRVIVSLTDRGPPVAWSPASDALAYLQPTPADPVVSEVVLVPLETLESTLVIRGSAIEANALKWLEERGPVFEAQECDSLPSYVGSELDPLEVCPATMTSEDTAWSAVGGRKLLHRQEGGVLERWVDVPDHSSLEPVVFTHDSTGLIMKEQPANDWFEHYLVDLTDPSLSRAVEIGWVKPQSRDAIALTDTYYALAAGVAIVVGELVHGERRARISHQYTGYEWAAFVRWQPLPTNL